MTKEIGCAECGVSGGHALYCLSCTEKFFIKGKEWVSLTDEEMMDAIYVDDTPMERGRRVEAKLRSKNNEQ